MAQEGLASQHSTSNPMPGHQPPARIGLDELIEAASNGVMRAIEARSLGESTPLRSFPFPIVIGIIYLPDGLGASVARQVSSPATQESTGS
jgi:hypothetical protein